MPGTYTRDGDAFAGVAAAGRDKTVPKQKSMRLHATLDCKPSRRHVAKAITLAFECGVCAGNIAMSTKTVAGSAQTEPEISVGKNIEHGEAEENMQRVGGEKN